MRAFLLTTILLATTLAGCTGDDASDDPTRSEPSDDGTNAMDDGASPTDPTEEPVADPWDGATEAQILERTIELADASTPNPLGTGGCAGSEATGTQDPKFHTCPYQWFFLDDGVLVLPGTASIRINASHTSSTDLMWRVYPQCTADRCAEDDASLQPDFADTSEATWGIDITSADWDADNATNSETYFVIEWDNASPPPAQTSVDVTITILRDPDWQPPN